MAKPGFLRSLAVLALCGSLAASGGPQGRGQRPLRRDTAAVVKLVPVRVLDPQGRPVQGLTLADFALTDNGEARTITEFETHASRGRDLASKGPSSEAAPSGSSRKIFFVLDMQGSDFDGNRDAKKAVLAFVKDSLSPGDEASVMTFGAYTGLLLRQYLTSDPAKIERAIKRSIELPSGGPSPRPRSVVDRAPATRPERSRGGTPARPFGYDDDDEGLSLEVASNMFDRTARSPQDFERSMSELATAMKFIPGSKSIIYFSTRTPDPAVGRIFAEANATVFAVNTNSAHRTGSAEVRRMKERQGEALKVFSESSGGRYFAEVQDARGLAADIEALSGSYYVLGYYVNPSWDGRQHAITVTVNRPDFTVLAQTGYSDPKPYLALSDLEKKLQLFDMLLSDTPLAADALDLPARVLQGSAAEAANAAVLLKLEVDERTGVPPGTTEVYIVVIDEEDKLVLAEKAELDTRSAGQTTLHPYFLAKLAPGTYECRVAARDKETGLALFSRSPFSIAPPSGPRRCSLETPLLLVPAEKPEFARMSRPPAKGREPLSILDFYPHLPRFSVPLLRELDPEARMLAVLLPFRSGRLPAPTDLRVALVDAASAAEVPIDWTVLDRQRHEPDLSFLLIRIDVARLGAGSYRLHFQAFDPGTGTNSSTSADLIKR